MCTELPTREVQELIFALPVQAAMFLLSRGLLWLITMSNDAYMHIQHIREHTNQNYCQKKKNGIIKSNVYISFSRFFCDFVLYQMVDNKQTGKQTDLKVQSLERLYTQVSLLISGCILNSLDLMSAKTSL